MARKKKKTMFEGALCTPYRKGTSEWVHAVLAALIIVLAFVTESWATWVIVIAAAVIFLSVIVVRCVPQE